jgi:ligand-binding sensor domain-containing protein
MKNSKLSSFLPLNKAIVLGFIILFTCAFQGKMFSQAYNFTTYNTSNSGIGSNFIHDIKIDNDGVVWIANNGITTYDGTYWINYNSLNSGLVSNNISDIEFDNLNRKWFGSFQNGISLLEGENWTNFTTSNSQLPSNTINDISIDNSNNIWIATNQGLAQYNGIEWTIYNTSNSVLTSNNINSVYTDASNNVWISISILTNIFGVYWTNVSKLLKFDGISWNIYENNLQLSFTKIFGDFGDGIYLKGGYGFVKFYDNTYTQFSYFDNTNCHIDCQIEDVEMDNENNLWVGNFQECAIGGLLNYTNCESYFSSNSGLPENNIMLLEKDNSNNMWIGTYSDGLVKMSPIDLGANDSTSKLSISICPNPTNDVFTIRSGEHGINKFDYKIQDFSGRVISAGRSRFNDNINIANLASGHYIIQIGTENGKTLTEKIVKN